MKATEIEEISERCRQQRKKEERGSRSFEMIQLRIECLEHSKRPGKK